MGNPFGRSVIIPLTNQSGGGVVAGDVVIVDTAHNDAFTTTTSANFTGGVGIAQQTIGAGAVGLVLVSGYAALVNVNASVTRGHFGATYTVVKQATDAGATRGVGTFCQFLTGGTTPDALVYPVDLLGSSLTNPMTTKGDIIIADTGGTPTRLAAGSTAGMVLTSAGSGAFETFSLPPGYEFDYTQSTTADTSITATTEGTATTVVTAAAVAYNGSTTICIEFFAPQNLTPSTNGQALTFVLYDDTGGGAASIGQFGVLLPGSINSLYAPVRLTRRLTPSNATHTFSVRAFGTGATGHVYAGAGGSGALMPLFIRQTKV